VRRGDTAPFWHEWPAVAVLERFGGVLDVGGLGGRRRGQGGSEGRNLISELP
jgi:hypothetical protein